MQDEATVVYAVVVSPDFAYGRSGVALAASASGVFLADCHLTGWRRVGEREDVPPLATSAAFAPDYPESGHFFAGLHGAVARFAAGGASFEVTPLTAPPAVIASLVVSPDYTRDGTIIAGTLEDGVFRSEDRGRLWRPANFGLLDMRVLALAPSSDYQADETLFAGTETGVFRSTNGGRAWRETAFPMDAGPVLSLACAPGIVVAGTETRGLFASHDDGKTWAPLGSATLTSSVNQIALDRDFPGSSRLAVLHDDRVLCSSDGGDSWADWNPALDGGITALAAPEGLGDGAWLLLGTQDGRILMVISDRVEVRGELTG